MIIFFQGQAQRNAGRIGNDSHGKREGGVIAHKRTSAVGKRGVRQENGSYECFYKCLKGGYDRDILFL